MLNATVTNITSQSLDTMLSAMTSVQVQMAALECAGMICAVGGTCVVRDFRAVCDCGGQACASDMRNGMQHCESAAMSMMLLFDWCVCVV